MKGLGEIDTFTGIVKREHGVIVLETGKGPSLEITSNGFNPHADSAALEPFIGKRVRIVGVPGSGRPVLIVNKLSDITVLGPPGRSARPPQP